MALICVDIPRASDNLIALSHQHKLILGSSSPWRRKVAVEAGIRIVDAISPDIDEKAFGTGDPETHTLAIAQAKADALVGRCSQMEDGILVCSDQVSVCLGEIREKPESEEEAMRFVSSYSAGSPVTTVAAVVLVDLRTGRRVHGHHCAVVRFRPMSAAALEQITRPGSVIYTCAGGFSVESPEMREFVASIEGGVDSVMGLPLALLEALLGRLTATGSSTRTSDRQ